MIVLNKLKCLICGSDKKALFGFPSDPKRAEIWREMLLLQDKYKEYSPQYFSNNARICDKHFPSSAFSSSFKSRLLSLAMPFDQRTLIPSELRTVESDDESSTSALGPYSPGSSTSQPLDLEQAPLKSSPSQSRTGKLEMLFKTEKDYWRGSDDENLISAANEVSRGVPLLTAALNHGVCQTTLRRFLDDRDERYKQIGPSFILTKSEEESLVSWIHSAARAGFAVRIDDVLDSVQRLLKNLNRENKFVDGRPGEPWLKSFLGRNPSVSSKITQNPTVTRGAVTAHSLQNWFSESFEYLQQEHLENILQEPNRIFNADETAFILNTKGGQVLTEQGSKTVSQQVDSSEKECITVLTCASADGKFGPPLALFKCEKIPEDLVKSVPQGWGLGKSLTGWMTGDLFYKYISNVFHQWLSQNKIPRPVVLFVDGNTYNLTLHTSIFCSENGIILLPLLPNAMHLIQPMDVTIFQSLKESWKTRVHEWKLSNKDNPILKKKDFCPLLEKVLKENVPPSVISSGFEKSGLFPWNANVPLSNIRKEIEPVKNSEQNQKELLSALDVLERYIGRRKLNSFEKSDHWSGPEEDRSLFQVWLNMKSDVSGKQRSDHSKIIPGDKTPNKSKSTTPASVSPKLDGQLANHSSKEIDANGLSENDGQAMTPNHNIKMFVCPSPLKKVLIWSDDPNDTTSKPREGHTVPSLAGSDNNREYTEEKDQNQMDDQQQKKRRKVQGLSKKEKAAVKKKRAKEIPLKNKIPRKL